MSGCARPDWHNPCCRWPLRGLRSDLAASQAPTRLHLVGNRETQAVYTRTHGTKEAS